MFAWLSSLQNCNSVPSLHHFFRSVCSFISAWLPIRYSVRTCWSAKYHGDVTMRSTLLSAPWATLPLATRLNHLYRERVSNTTVSASQNPYTQEQVLIRMPAGNIQQWHEIYMYLLHIYIKRGCWVAYTAEVIISVGLYSLWAYRMSQQDIECMCATKWL